MATVQDVWSRTADGFSAELSTLEANTLAFFMRGRGLLADLPDGRETAGPFEWQGDDEEGEGEGYWFFYDAATRYQIFND
jgi:hypothetical protein